jgi:hypothetical protein
VVAGVDQLVTDEGEVSLFFFLTNPECLSGLEDPQASPARQAGRPLFFLPRPNKRVDLGWC